MCVCMCVCMRAADPRVCPRAENAESDQQPEHMLPQRACQIPVTKTSPSPSTLASLFLFSFPFSNTPCPYIYVELPSPVHSAAITWSRVAPSNIAATMDSCCSNYSEVGPDSEVGPANFVDPVFFSLCRQYHHLHLRYPFPPQWRTIVEACQNSKVKKSRWRLKFRTHWPTDKPTTNQPTNQPTPSPENVEATDWHQSGL